MQRLQAGRDLVAGGGNERARGRLRGGHHQIGVGAELSRIVLLIAVDILSVVVVVRGKEIVHEIGHGIRWMVELTCRHRALAAVDIVLLDLFEKLQVFDFDRVRRIGLFAFVQLLLRRRQFVTQPGILLT